MKDNPHGVRYTNVTKKRIPMLCAILTLQSIIRSLLLRDILTLQSLKENPYVARYTNVTIDEKESYSTRDTKVKINERESLECAIYSRYNR